MDIVTQGVLGATLAQSAAQKEYVRWAACIGFVSGMLADLDIFIRSKTDPLLFLEYHRHFTHSIIFIPLGGLLAFLLVWPFFRKKLPAHYIFLYCLLGFLLSGFIDACTSYGTHLFWPFTHERISWHIISIIDPIFTGVLICLLITGWKTCRNSFSRYGLVFIVVYLSVAYLQFQRAEAEVYTLAEQRNHAIEKIVVKPTLGNILLWRSVYLSGEIFYIDAVRVGFERRIFEGTSIPQYKITNVSSDINHKSVQYRDIKRFEFFSDGYLATHPERKNIIGDIRYSMNPISAYPLWGIELSPDHPNKHVNYVTLRESSTESRKEFIQMLLNTSMK